MLASLLDEIARVDGAEVTVECNPEDASAALFDAWRRAGVTRVSFGVQSMVPAVLSELSRRVSLTRAVGQSKVIECRNEVARSRRATAGRERRAQ